MRGWVWIALGLALSTNVWVVEPDPSQAAQVFARQTQQVTARVHLIFKPAVTDPPFEGNSIVIEQAEGLVVVDAGGAPPSGAAIPGRAS